MSHAGETDPRWDPGWRPDPRRRFDERYFNGRDWTDRVRVGDAVAVDLGEDVGPDAGNGWHPDPTGRFDAREFDGHGWTKRVRADTAVAVDTVGVPEGTARPDGGSPRDAERSAQRRTPGWYPDPDGDDRWTHWDPPREGPDKERYWDGHAWTAKTRVGGGRSPGWWDQPFVRLALRRAAVVLTAVVLLVLLVTLLR